MVRGWAERLVAHLEHDRELVVVGGVGEPGVEDPDDRRLVGLRTDLVRWCAAESVDVVASDDDRVTDVGVFDQVTVCLERGHESVHFAGDLERVGVVDKTGELVGEGGVELDSDAVTLPEILH
jgi:hypothetical protein